MPSGRLTSATTPISVPATRTGSTSFAADAGSGEPRSPTGACGAISFASPDGDRLAKSPRQHVLSAPLITIVEAKNDNLRSGLGQCIAAMVAAWEFNAKSLSAVTVVYGVVTTGSAWKFLRLSGSKLTLDVEEYFIAELGRIMGILAHILKAAEQGAAADRPCD